MELLISGNAHERGMFMKNNLFQFATKELSQDAMLCWLINFINYPELPMFKLGKSVLDMFLGDNKQQEYYNVKVKTQFNKIDILVLFNNKYALIIEDKTNTSEHGEQIQRYKKALKNEYPEYQIITSYIKTGIMYDNDYLMKNKVDTVIDIYVLFAVLSEHKSYLESDILDDYLTYLESIIKYRKEIDEKIVNGDYANVLMSGYGQYSFLNRIFDTRSKGTEIGKRYIDGTDGNEAIYIDQIYADANKDGTVWSQYCFWGQKYSVQILNNEKIEYHYLFWRIESKGANSYIALRHYDENAHSKTNEGLNERKRVAYFKFREKADKLYNDYYKDENKPALFKKIGKRDNYKESDLLFIPIKNLDNVRAQLK